MKDFKFPIVPKTETKTENYIARINTQTYNSIKAIKKLSGIKIQCIIALILNEFSKMTEEEKEELVKKKLSKRFSVAISSEHQKMIAKYAENFSIKKKTDIFKNIISHYVPVILKQLQDAEATTNKEVTTNDGGSLPNNNVANKLNQAIDSLSGTLQTIGVSETLLACQTSESSDTPEDLTDLLEIKKQLLRIENLLNYVKHSLD